MAKSKTVLGLQVLDQEVRLLLAEVGENEITPVFTRTVHGADAVSKAMRALPKRPAGVVCAVPLGDGAIRTLNLPPTTDENLERVVTMEAETALPLGTEDLALAHHMLGMNEQSRLEVLLAAARQDTVQQALRYANAATYISAQATLSAIALVNALQQLRGTGRESACAILNIEARYSELVVLDRGRILSTQSFSSGSASHVPVPLVPEAVPVGVGAGELMLEAGGLAAPPQPWVQDLAHQVRYALQAISYERGIAFERLWVCGGGAAGASIDWQLSGLMDLPVSVLAPNQGAGADAPSYAAAFGCAVQAAGQAGIALNLTPTRVTIAREVEQRRQNTLSWGALAGAGVLAAALVFGAAVYRKNQELAVLEGQLREIGGGITAPAVTPKELRDAETAVNEALTVRVPAAKLISTLSQKLPEGVWIEELTYTPEGGARVRGAAKSPGGPQQAAVALLGEQVFDEVTLDNVTEDRIGNTPVWTYQISGKLRPKEVRRRGAVRR